MGRAGADFQGIGASRGPRRRRSTRKKIFSRFRAFRGRVASDGGRVAAWAWWLGGCTPTLSQRTPATTTAMSGLRKIPATNQLSDDGADANDCRHATILRRGEDVGRRAFLSGLRNYSRCRTYSLQSVSEMTRRAFSSYRVIRGQGGASWHIPIK